MSTDEAAFAWLDHEDSICRSDRAARLAWLAAQTPPALGWALSGGWLSYQLFEEARYSYVYGQFIATSVMGFAFVERTLAALSFRSGKDDAKRATGQRLIEDAVVTGLLSVDEGEAFQRARLLRNPLVHFREPGHRESPEIRAVLSDVLPEDVIAADAQQIVGAMFRLLSKQSVG